MEPWLILTEGAEALEAPYDVLDDLLREFGVLSREKHRDPEGRNGFDVVATGWIGSKAAGYRWKETRDSDSNMYVSCSIETFGIESMELQWSFTLAKSGYDHLYRHGRLRVRFVSDEDRRRFAAVWHGKAGRRPTLVPEVGAG